MPDFQIYFILQDLPSVARLSPDDQQLHVVVEVLAAASFPNPELESLCAAISRLPDHVGTAQVVAVAPAESQPSERSIHLRIW